MRVIVSLYKTKVFVKVYDYSHLKTPLVLKYLPYKYGSYTLEFRAKGFVFAIDFYNDKFNVNSFSFDIEKYTERHFKACTVYVLDCQIRDLFS